MLLSWLLVVAGDPGHPLTGICPRQTPLMLYDGTLHPGVSLLHPCVHITFFLSGHHSYWIWYDSNSVWAHLNLTMSAKIPFLLRLDPEYMFLGDTIQLTTETIGNLKLSEVTITQPYTQCNIMTGWESTQVPASHKGPGVEVLSRHYWVVTWRVKHWVQRTRKEETEFQKLGQVARHEERGIWGQWGSRVIY